MRIQSIKCDKCGAVFISGQRPDGLPNGVGFKMQDGTVVSMCANCMIKLGKLREAGDEAGAEKFLAELKES